jgi:drug/metabolite transporter (DMT)-like permease
MDGSELNQIMKKLIGFLSLLLAALIFGSMSIFVRYLGHDFTVYQQIGFRNILGLGIAILLILSLKRKVDLKKIPKKYLFLYALAFPLSVVFYTLAIYQTKVITTIFGLYAGSLLFSLGIGILLFKEKVTVIKALSLLLVFIGLLIYVYPFSLSQLNLGFGFALLAGIADAVANSFRKYLSGKTDRLVLASIPMVGGILVAFAFLTASHQLFIPSISPLSWLIGIIFGGLVLSISYLTLVGFQNFDLNLGTIILSSELFFGPMFAFLIFRESPSFFEISGGVLIMAAIVIMNFDRSWFKLFRAFKQVPFTPAS